MYPRLFQKHKIRDLHDGVIRLQLPESFTFSVSYANQGNCYLRWLVPVFRFLTAHNFVRIEHYIIYT